MHSNLFLTNETKLTFLEKLRQNLRTCKSFCFSVSFIKKAGLVLLYKDIEAAVLRGCKGRVITSTYQNFTDIESLKSFFALMGKDGDFECHLDHECFTDSSSSTRGYHSKGYLFDFGDSREVIVGSSNLTRYALLKNIEWDVVVCEDEVYAQAMAEFTEKWNATHTLNTDIINLYANKLNFAIERWDMDYDLSTAAVKPNFMQRKALKELNRFRAVGTNRALVVAAAGSGKTYLAAFDALNFAPKRLLYVVHEGSILKKALETFQDVFGSAATCGLYTGESKEMDADFVFSTNVTMGKSLELFSKETFDYIIIDECHHATAESYRKIIAYFEPEFLLGLTATPERMDNRDVFALFDQNVPYELRLRDAIVNDLVVPFHYYGIHDALVNYGLSKNEERRLIAQMVDEEHCAFIAEQIEKHRPQGKLKALAFCRSINHARMLCETMQERYKTAYLTGKNSIGERIRAYNELQSDSGETEILFTVDLLNEGVDIPGVNMVLFLRPTESSTVFIQQLGRGLRKYNNKSYVTVLDFIGNSYKRSVQIAFALSSLAENFVLEKRLMASLLKDDFSALGLRDYGVEIHIDDLSKEEILANIDNENFNALKYLRQDYFNFKNYIHAQYVPRHMDYFNNDCAPDLIRFMSVKIGGRKTCSYYNFLCGIGEGKDLPMFTEEQVHLVDAVSGLLPLVRPHEYGILQCILRGISERSRIEAALAEKIVDYAPDQVAHALRFMDYLAAEDERIVLKTSMNAQLAEYLEDLVSYGLARYHADYGEETGFKLWQNYRMDQVQLKLLKNPAANQKGTYFYDDRVVIFASLKKDLEETHKLNYKDRFLQADVFQWESEAHLSRGDYEKLNRSRVVELFIRKMASENGLTLPFTYVGRGALENCRPTNNGNGTYLFDVRMENALPDYLQYDFGLPLG